MAHVFQIVATNDSHPDFEPALIDGNWHVGTNADTYRTLCGVQLDGDDGVSPGPTRQGYVTCQICAGTIEEIKAIRKWKRPAHLLDKAR